VVFQVDCDEIELQKISYDVIFVTSSQLRQPIDVTKISGYASSRAVDKLIQKAHKV